MLAANEDPRIKRTLIPPEHAGRPPPFVVPARVRSSSLSDGLTQRPFTLRQLLFCRRSGRLATRGDGRANRRGGQ